MNHQEALTNYVMGIAGQLVAAGVRKAVISPGSRSTPLAYVLEDHPLIDCHVNVDERSAGFYALGMAKRTGNPVVLLCTSGTAAANYYPAVVEASYSRVPLVVVTADRPHELREVGAPQAIDQVRMFGVHVKDSFDLPLPEPSETVFTFVQQLTFKMTMLAAAEPAGPVHLNVPFREPLIPLLDGSIQPEVKPIRSVRANEIIDSSDLMTLAKAVDQHENGLIVVGPIGEQAMTAVAELAEKSGYPVLADPLSHGRLVKRDGAVLESYDAFLKIREVTDSLKPTLVIRFGGMPVSKPLTLYLQTLTATEHWLVDSGGKWRDPLGTTTVYIPAEPARFADTLKQEIQQKTEFNWLKRWQAINSAAVEAIEAHLDEEHDEGTQVGRLLRSLPDHSHLFVGNSMPVRDVDTFYTGSSSHVKVWANRGANGIDGIVSTALGVSAVSDEPVYLLLGDLSFFHDLNGMLAGRQHGLNLTIIVMNNDGGGIFSYLPPAKEPKHFETLFGTPQSLTFESVAAMYGAHYERVDQADKLGKEQLRHSGLSIVEVMTDREHNVITHRKLWDKVASRVREVSING